MAVRLSRGRHRAAAPGGTPATTAPPVLPPLPAPRGRLFYCATCRTTDRLMVVVDGGWACPVCSEVTR